MKKILVLSAMCFSIFPAFANVDVFRSADRPQLTEKPHTIGEGHFQVEGSAFQYALEKDKQYTRHEFSFLSVEGNYGLNDVIDLFVSFDALRIFNPNIYPARAGMGNLRIGAEYNLWGNRQYNSALSIAPFVKFPTSTHNFKSGEPKLLNDAVEFGVKAPFSLELVDEFTFGAMIEFDVYEDVVGADGYHLELVNSVSISRPIIDAFAMYAEYYSRNTFEDNVPWVAVFGLGGVFALDENFLLDASVRAGLTEAAEDFRAILGGSYRF